MGARFSDLIEAALREARKRAPTLSAQPGNGRTGGATTEPDVDAGDDALPADRAGGGASGTHAEPPAVAPAHPGRAHDR